MRIAAGVLAAGILAAASASASEVPLMNDAAPLVLAGGFDLGATEWALGHPGLKEWNPLAGTRSKRVTIKTASNAGALVIIRHLRSTGRHGAATWTKRGVVVAQVFAGGWALRQRLRQERRGGR